MTFRDRPLAHLTRHFYRSLFDLGFLSETGTMWFTRLIVGVCAIFLSFGLLLARVYLKKYQLLNLQHAPDGYQLAILGDHALLIAIPMWVVAFTTVLAGHAVFPDALDFRVLMALPINRRLVFGAKLLALAMFIGLFVAATHVALAPLALMTMVSHFADGFLVVRLTAYLAASVVASAFAALTVVAIHGLLVLAVPSGRLLAVSAAMRSVMLCALMMSLPLVMRFPATSVDLAAGTPWLLLAPPAWFVGLERWLLGDPRPHLAYLALLGTSTFALVAMIAAGAYALLYGHFEGLIVRRVESTRPDPARSIRAGRLASRHPVFLAVRSFAFKTLRRSVLHQGVVVVLAAVGAGLVVNSFVGSGVVAWLGSTAAPRRAVLASLHWAPYALIFVACRAVRMALLLPIEPKANWVFRMTEREVFRRDQIGAAVSAVYVLGVIAPVIVLAPVQWVAFGASAGLPIVLALLFGWLYVELLMLDWARLPFTCSYIPGKRFVPQMVLLGTGQFLLFTSVSSGLAGATMQGHPSAIALDVMAAGAAVFLWRRRVEWSRHTPLEFEDELPTELNTLRLSPD